MDPTAVCGDHVLQRYRQLLDAEDEAFDALEHDSEDGDRVSWEAHFRAWQAAATKKIAYLQELGFDFREAAPARSG